MEGVLKFVALTVAVAAGVFGAGVALEEVGVISDDPPTVVVREAPVEVTEQASEESPCEPSSYAKYLEGC